MNDDTTTEKKITITKGSTHSLHIRCPYNPAYIQRIRQITGRKWNPNRKCGSYPTLLRPSRSLRASLIQMKFRLPRSKEPLQKALKLRGYSRKTIKAYCNQVERFLSSLSFKNTDVNNSNVQMYCLGLLERGISHSSVNQTISALRFYRKHVFHHPTDIQYIRPKKQTKLPQVMSEKEVAQLLKSVTNPKHNAILFLTYSSGLRR